MVDRCATVGSRSGGGSGWADAPMTAPKPQIDCDTVSDGRPGRVRAGGGERGIVDGLNRRGEPLLASRFAEARHA